MNRRISTVLAIAGLVVGFGVARYSNAAPSDPTINGCFNNTTGVVRVLAAGGDSCEPGKETALSWNSAQASVRWFRDEDGDGYGDWYRFVDSPAQPPGYVANNLDCDDNNATTNPGEATDPGPGDVNCNGVEAEDANITWYRDADGDGWGTTAHTVVAAKDTQPIGYVYRYGDCDDHDAHIHPYQTKCQHDGDVDEDGHRSTAVGGDDCNDADSREYPGNAERSDVKGHDEDCDPVTGGVIPYDPNVLDPRPASDPQEVPAPKGRALALQQEYFGPGGNLVTARPGSGVELDCASSFTHCGLWSTPPLYAS